VTDRLERILASLGTPERIDQETPREVVLACEVRRLRAQWVDLRAKVDAAQGEVESTYLRTREPHYAGERDAMGLVQQWMDCAGEPAPPGCRTFRAEPAARCPTCAALSIESVAAHRAHRGPTMAEQATAAAVTLAAERGATMDGLMLVLAEVQAWQAATFGDRCPPGARVVKLREEVEEVAEEVAMGAGADRERVAEEIADVLLMAMDIGRAYALTPADFVGVVRRKLTRNETRAWGQAGDGTFRGSKATP
jgi:NTP pyrophosphatase (non-canonical NTP hydrolase)